MTQKKRWAAAALAGLVAVSAALTGCAQEKPNTPKEEKYTKWIKVADGQYEPFRMPEYMNAKGLFVQRIGYEKPEETYYADIGASKAELVSSGFDLSREIQKAEDKLRSQHEDAGGITESYLPKKNALLLQCNLPDLWIYHIESGELELLGDGSYMGKPYSQVYEAAYKQWGEESYVYSYAGVMASPNEQFLAFSSTLAEVESDKGQEVYLYDMNEKTERLLLSGESKAENYTAKGWVNNRWLLCIKDVYKMVDGVSQGVESREALLVNTAGERIILNLPDAGSPEAYSYLHTGNGIIVAAYGGDPAHIIALKARDDGSVQVIMDYTAMGGSLINDAKISSLAARAAYLNAPDRNSAERELHVIDLQEKSERVISPPNIGEGVETSFGDFYWIDENRMLINIRESWEKQETVSTWILDLRAGAPVEDSTDGNAEDQTSQAAVTGSEPDPNSEQGEPDPQIKVTPSAIEIDTVRTKDQAKVRDASTMADGYLAIMKSMYDQAPELAGKEGGLSYIALDTSEMSWISDEEKEILIQKIAETWNVEVLNKTQTQLKEEGYLNAEGYFEKGILFWISGGWNFNNEMKTDAIIWRSAPDSIRKEGIVVRFENDAWNVVK